MEDFSNIIFIIIGQCKTFDSCLATELSPVNTGKWEQEHSAEEASKQDVEIC